MTMKYLPDVKLSEEARNQNFYDITWLVCKLQTKIPKKTIFRDATVANPFWIPHSISIIQVFECNLLTQMMHIIALYNHVKMKQVH